MSEQTAVEPRRQFVDHLYREFGSSEALDVLLGATLGVKDVIGERVLRVFQRLGLTHVLVVSGFHIAVVYSILYVSLRWLLCRSESFMLCWSSRRIAAVVAFAGVCAGVSVVGAEQPVVRSLVVFGIFALGQALGRRADSFRLYVLSIAALHLIWPGAILDVGFMLTYSSVLGLYMAGVWEKYAAADKQAEFEQRFIIPELASQASRSEMFQPDEKAYELGRSLIRRGKRCARQMFLCSLGACVCTMPITAAVFGLLVPLAPLINLLFGWLFTWCFIIAGGLALFAHYFSFPCAKFGLQLSLKAGEQLLVWCLACDQLLQDCGLGSIAYEPGERTGAVLAATAIFLAAALVTLHLLGREEGCENGAGSNPRSA